MGWWGRMTTDARSESWESRWQELVDFCARWLRGNQKLGSLLGGHLVSLRRDLFKTGVPTPALMMDMGETIIDRIAFGGAKELEELYQQ
jgi:hypothetical protein